MDALEWRSRDRTSAATPLDRSYAPYYMQSWPMAARLAGVRGTVRYRYAHGRRYDAWSFDDAPGDDDRWRAAEHAAPTLWEREWLPTIRADLARLRALDLASLADDELGHALRDVLDVHVRHWTIHARVAAVWGAVERLVAWYRGRFPDASETEPYVLVQGTSNLSVEHGHRLWRLAQLVEPAATAALRAGGASAGSPAFRAELADYLDEFGFRLGEGGLAGPLWRDDPGPALQLVLQYAESGAPDPRRQTAELANRRRAATDALRARLRPDELAELDDLLATALAASPIAEDHAYWIDQRSAATLQPVCAEIGRRLIAAGEIEAPGDVAFLRLDELLAWTFGASDPLRPRVDARRAEHAGDLRADPPELLGSPPPTLPDDGTPVPPDVPAPAGATAPMPPSAEAPHLPAGAGSPSPLAAGAELLGIAASPGVARGPARVAATRAMAAELRRGEVLVCPGASPEWAPLFGIAAALVADAGGAVSHAAVVAREYGLPAVLGTGTATRRLRTGQLVEVDGAAGIVRALD